MKQTNFPEAIIIHCSAGRDHEMLDYLGIWDWHVRHNHWLDVGYHILIDRVQGRELVLLGRPFWQEGAHCWSMNKKSLGICVIGDFDELPPTDAKLQKTAQVCAAYCSLLKIPVRDIRPHNAYARDGRTCPGKQFDMDRLKRLTREVIRSTFE